jgi:hypothetical protein
LEGKKGESVKLGIMQPYFLPYIGYWQLINAVDKYVIYDDVNFINRGWINRNNILLNKRQFLFTLTLSGASQNKLINEIIVHEEQTKLIKTFEMAYKKAPFFEEVFLLVKQIFDYNDKNLAKFIGNSIVRIATYLGLKTEFVYSSEIEKDCSLKGQEKILNICNTLQATEYFNAIGGMNLYNKVNFDANSIKLRFLKALPVEYKQFNSPFVPNLSILDVMMFNSVEEIGKMLREYELA